MATAVPKKRWSNGNGHNPVQPRNGQGAYLSYVGKEEETTILSSPRAETCLLWPKHANSKIVTSNRLYFGDNLPILASLLDDTSVRGQVRLIYIDPPFGTRGVFQSRNQNDAYTDTLSGSVYIEFLRKRLLLLRELLAANGSIYVHLDENTAFEAKILMDEIFGRGNFRNWIVRRKCNRKNYTRKTYGNIADYLLFYTKSDDYVWNRPLESWSDEAARREYSYVEKETGRRYKKVPIHAPGARNGATGTAWRGMLPPPGKHWQYLPLKLDEFDVRGEIVWSATGNPRRKIYLDQSVGVPYQDIWLDFLDAHNQNIAITGYPTEKNPNLLATIVKASSNEGDLVLDCFAGSGTTLAIADANRRRWIGMDNSAEAIATTLRRFLKGVEPMGDFVTERYGERNRDRSKRTKKAPDFFENSENSQVRTEPSAHEPIIDFQLLCEVESVQEISTIVHEWERDLNPSKGRQMGHWPDQKP